MVIFKANLNSETTKQLNKFSLKRMWWVVLIPSVLFIVIGVLGGFVFPEDGSDTVFGIVMISLGVLFTPAVWLLTRLLQRNLDESATYIAGNTEETYTFSENGIEILQVNEQFRSWTSAKYPYLYRVNESATHYFLYISKAQCHVIPKAALTEGSLEELNSLLSSNLGVKFKRK